GNTLSTHGVGERVGLVEATLGRPRRRVEVLAARLEALRTRVTALEAQLARWEREGRRPRRHAATEERLARLRGEVRELEERRATRERGKPAQTHPPPAILPAAGGVWDAP